MVLFAHTEDNDCSTEVDSRNIGTTYSIKVYIAGLLFYLMVKRKEGDRSKIFLNEVDVMILKIITQKNEVAIMWLRDYLKISAISLRTHINRMLELGLITRNKIPKTNRSILGLTKDGKDVLRIFEKAI